MRARSFARAHRELPSDYLRRILRFQQRLSVSRQPSRAWGRRVLRSGLLSTTALVGAAALVWASPAALAGPTGGTVVAGNATIATAGATTQITTNSQRTIINWTGVSLKPGETMSFVQPSVSAATLNRVTGNEPSLLQGTLSSNGQVYLINPNGIVVGQGIIAPNGQNVSGSTFNLTQGLLSAATPSNGTLTVNLFGAVASLSGSAVAGPAVELGNAGNRIGGTAHVTTGATPLSATVTSGDFNLGQSGILSLGTSVSNLDVVGRPGMLFGGPNALNAGAGSKALLGNAGNSFLGQGGQPAILSFNGVADTTLDGGSGVRVGDSAIDGSLAINVTDGIGVVGAVGAHNGHGTTPDTAEIVLRAGGDVTEAGGSLSAPTLTGSAGGSVSLGGGNAVAVLAGFSAGGGFLLDNPGTTQGLLVSAALGAGGSVTVATAGTLTVDAGVDGARVSLVATSGGIVLGATVNAHSNNALLMASGSILDALDGGTDVTAGTLSLSAGTGIGTATAPLEIVVATVAGSTGSGGINLVNTGASDAVATSLAAGAGDVRVIQQGGGSLVVDSVTAQSGNIVVDVKDGGSLTVTDAMTGNAGNIVLGLGSPLDLTVNGTVSASGALIGRADKDVTLDGATIQSLGGRTTLIVDDAFPDAPAIGPGSFRVTGHSTIATPANGLGIFLARQTQVEIPAGSLMLNGRAFSDAPQSAFVHFKTWYSVSEPFNGSAFTVFFKEGPPEGPADALPDGLEVEVPFDQLLRIGRDFPIGFGMLYGQQNRKSPDAIAQVSSYDMLPDEFSAQPRPLYLDVENPKTELLGYELRPEVYAQNVLARISTAAGGDEVSCKELSDILPLIQNPQAQADYRTLCAPREHDLEAVGEAAGGRTFGTPTRDRHYVRAVQR